MKQISKTKIEKRLKGKRNPELVETIIKLKKTNPEVAKYLSFPMKRWPNLNLTYIDKNSKENEILLIPGKILGSGNLTKKLKLISWSVSEGALEKIKKSGSEIKLIKDENKFTGVRILR
jgi:large subunit ribosomal protein L18e